MAPNIGGYSKALQPDNNCWILFSLRCLPVRAALPFMMVIIQYRKETVLGESLGGVFCGR